MSSTFSYEKREGVMSTPLKFGATRQLVEFRGLRLDANMSYQAMTLLNILARRRSSREFSPEPLPLYRLSRILWAAAGYNDSEKRLRTAPSARNCQEIDIYVATAEGLFLYDVEGSALRCVVARDIRALTGLQDFVATAPVNLVYVANFDRMDEIPQAQRELMAAISAGCMSQNVSLMCAAEALSTVVREMIDKRTLAGAIGLREDQEILLAQSLGWPKARVQQGEWGHGYPEN